MWVKINKILLGVNCFWTSALLTDERITVLPVHVALICYSVLLEYSHVCSAYKLILSTGRLAGAAPLHFGNSR